MTNEYYGVATTPTEDFLAHYGVKGMKWGVRKALMKGNEKRLARNFAKAEKKLAKLQKRADSGKKYAKRAVALGAGAALAGGVAATGTKGISAATRGVGNITGGALRGVGLLGGKAAGVMRKAGIRGAGKLASASAATYRAGVRTGLGVNKAATAIDKWGKGDSVGKALGNATVGASDLAYKAGVRGVGKKALDAKSKMMGVSNSGYTRLAGAIAGAGLGAGAAYNAYRAATTKRAAKKAAAFRAEMNKTFAGTKYANGRPAATPKKKRRG